MLNLKPTINRQLKKIGENIPIFFYYPKEFIKLPCISYYEISNSPYARADDKEYFSEILFVIDIWGENSSQISKLTNTVNNLMTEIFFERELSQDIFDTNTEVKHKTMRFKYIGGYK